MPNDSNGKWVVCADGEFLCGKCVGANILRITEATMTRNPAREDMQWRIVGAQEVDLDPTLETPEQCAHCYTKHPTE